MLKCLMDTSVIRLSLCWFVLSALVVAWDSGFVLLRPWTMPGGHLHFFWKPYSLYMEVDKAYGDMQDTFVIAQSWLNVVEVFLSFAAVILLIRRDRGGFLVAFFVSSLTFWKTVLYMLQCTSLCNGSHRLAHTSWNESIFIFLLPNGVWLIFPLFFTWFYGTLILSLLRSQGQKN